MSEKFTITTISPMPDQFVGPQATISFEADSAMDAESAQSAVRVSGPSGPVPGRVVVGDDGLSAIWSPIEPMAEGDYTLVIEELISDDGVVLDATRSMPFFVVSSLASVPDDVTVQSVARLVVEPGGVRRLSLGEEPTGEYVELMKGLQGEEGTPVELIYDAQGAQTDASALVSPADLLDDEGSKLNETLQERLQEMDDADQVKVAIWLPFDDSQYTLVKPGDSSRPVSDEMAIADDVDDQAAQYSQDLSALTTGFAQQLSPVTDDALADAADDADTVGAVADTAAPVVYASLSKSDIIALADRDDVASVFLYDEEGIDDLSASIGIANSDDVHTNGFDGSGVKVAVWERGPDDTSLLQIEAAYANTPGPSQHSRHTHGIIKNTHQTEPNGHAPGCDLYSANSYERDALRWAVQDQQCTVISQSFHRRDEARKGTLQDDDIYKDWLATHPPYPTIIQAAGNYSSGDSDGINPPEDEYVNHKGYNSLAVGNHNDAASAMAGSSVFRNPISPNGDRELPEICANGTAVTAVGLTKGGTSMAAPAVAGCAALIQQVDSTLKSWPEGCRAILLAGATRNVTGNTWWQDVTARNDSSDGAGAVNALESTRIAKSRRSRDANATRRGWDVGTSAAGDFGADRLSTYSYSVRVPVNGPNHVKTALTWDSKVTTSSGQPVKSELAVDMDLVVYNSAGDQVAHSGSWDNSYEITEFDGVRGETYTIKLRRWSGGEDTWYGIAWTVV